MTLTDLLAIATAFGVGSIVPEAFRRTIDAVTERGKRKQSDAARLSDLLDRERRKRRRFEDALHETRIAARQYGLPLDQLPPWPDGTGGTKTLGE